MDYFLVNTYSSAHNYQKKHRNAPLASLENYKGEAQNRDSNIILKGELDSKFLIDKVADCENKIEHINQQIIGIESIQAEHNSEISDLKNQISSIESGDKAKLLKRSDLSDLALYNRFLNREYLNEMKKGNKFAHTRLKSEFAITSSNNPMIKIEIETYRDNIKSLVDNFDNDINIKKEKIEFLRNKINQHDSRIKELRNQLRFYEGIRPSKSLFNLMISAAIFARKRDYGKEKDFSSGNVSACGSLA